MATAKCLAPVNDSIRSERQLDFGQTDEGAPTLRRLFRQKTARFRLKNGDQVSDLDKDLIFGLFLRS